MFLLGWALGSTLLTGISRNYVPIAPSTALCFILLSVFFCFYLQHPDNFVLRTLTVISALLTLLICSIILIGFITGITFEAERLGFNPLKQHHYFPVGNMSPITATNFIAASSGVLFLLLPAPSRQLYKNVTAFCGAGLIVVSVILLIGYLYGTPLLYGGSIIPVALPTAVTFVFLGLGMMTASGPYALPVRIFSAPTLRSRLIRTFLPFLIFFIFIHDLLAREISSVTQNPALTSSTITVFFTIFFGVIVVKFAKTIGDGIDQAHAELRNKEVELKKLNEELERRVATRTTQLELVVKELEAFSFSISHDLKAPLLAIDGFSRILRKDYPDKPLDETGRDYLERICKGTQRMDRLIDAMLQLAKVTRSEFHRQFVDLSKMARAIAEQHRQHDPDRSVAVTIQEGIVVWGDPDLLRIALENLIGNAWKFTGKKERPQIEFGMTLEAGEITCFIRDNGAGFDMTYADKLFGPFQRLHKTDQFPGTGIGLATVRRIIARHGGRVWAQGAVGQGATLFFTLPSRLTKRVAQEDVSQ